MDRTGIITTAKCAIRKPAAVSFRQSQGDYHA